MNITALISALPGACCPGTDPGQLWQSVFILLIRTLDLADLTVDGTMCTGGAVCIMMMLSGHNVSGIHAGRCIWRRYGWQDLRQVFSTPLWEFRQSWPVF